MYQQKSFSVESSEGLLYLVPTPIGNLEDMTFRAIRILKEVDMIAAEDTRHTKKLCNYFDITTPIISYHDHNKMESGQKIVNMLLEGKHIALVSDAGMPAISDPGYELVIAVIQEQLKVIPLPGANAALPSLVASGLQSQPFYFYGFLSRQKKDKKEEIEKLKMIDATLILYESPHRLKDTLKLLLQQIGNRRITIVRELTKKFEEFIRGNIEEALEWAESTEIKGEFCLIIEGASDIDLETDSLWWSHLSVLQHVEYYMNDKGMDSKEAIKQVAKERDLPKREVYQVYHQ